MRRILISLAAVAAAATMLAGCSGAADEKTAADGLEVAASFYPLAFVTEQVGGDRVVVTDLTPKGGSAHDLEISPKQATQLAEQDLAVYLGAGFQPAVEQAIEVQQVPAFNAMDVVSPEQLREGDAHIWLNPMIMAAIGDELATKMAELDPEGAAEYTENAATFRAQMAELNAKYEDQLAGCAGATLVASHEAFGYLADAYGLEQLGITGINPEAEPSPKRLREVAQIVEERDVTTIFFESATAAATEDRLAESVGVKTAQLNPLEATPDTDFVTVMETNLSALREGLNCK